MEVLDGFDRQGKELSLPGEEDDEDDDEEEENEEKEEPGLSYLQQELGVSYNYGAFVSLLLKNPVLFGVHDSPPSSKEFYHLFLLFTIIPWNWSGSHLH